MSHRNFNTRNMKVAFYDVDEYEEYMEDMDNETLTKLLLGIDYGLERADNRCTNVRMIVVLDPEVRVSDKQRAAVMAHLADKSTTILTIMDDLVVCMTPTKHVFALKILGEAKYITAAPPVAPPTNDEALAESQFEELDDMGLTQECDLSMEPFL